MEGAPVRGVYDALRELGVDGGQARDLTIRFDGGQLAVPDTFDIGAQD